MGSSSALAVSLSAVALLLAATSRADEPVCSEAVMQQLAEVSQRLGTLLPDPWLLQAQSSGRRNKGSLLCWGLVSGLSRAHAESAGTCGSQLRLKLPLDGMARLALPFATSPVFFEANVKATANLTWPGPRVTGLSVDELTMTEVSRAKSGTPKEGDRAAEFLSQVTARVAQRSIREQLPRLLLVALAPQSPLVLERRLLVY
ncbi:hypothetical protein V5799_007053 [Amblyomma americanum]|uniref:Secreted protein n=1 Tax=Amblyomma americanum TaxID=6943 RepID=A0AAQ4DUM5_AMBAM